MELQALRYAAMVSTMTFEHVVAAHSDYLKRRQIDGDAEERILSFLQWTEPRAEDFNQDVKIILVSSDFSKEIATAVMWLNQRDIDIRCVRLTPYRLDDRLLIDVQQVIPLPEASEYQVKLKEKGQAERAGKSKQWDEQSFMAKLLENKGQSYVEVARFILDWSKDWADDIWWGSGARSGSFIPVFTRNGTGYYVFAVWTYGTVEIQFQWLARRAAFVEEAKRRELRDKLNSIHGVSIPEDALERRPGISLEVFADRQALQVFKETLEWAIDVATEKRG